ncbi:KR domain-containing protein, partial [Desulfovibrio sp.]|uniref:KR domain-containing protein n=1 Tax=Desulfovibrio sp. TaxID=885 RepID=UPI002A756A42
MPQGCHEKRQDLVLDNIPLLSFMKRCGENFREILGGRKDPRQVMFPGGNPDAVESIYQDTPQSRYYNGIMARSLKALADALPMDRALSILEIGAGTGGTTSALLPVLPAGRTRYVYTDVSPLFTARARDRFAAFPFVEYATLDISRDPFLQGFHADEFDIVVCANVLHATADLTAALRHISAVLAADGLLLLREITLPRPAMGFEISFGCLLDKLRDGELRGDNPFLTAEGWTRLLDTEGFDRTACYPAPADGDLDEHVIIARNGNGSRQAFSTGIAPARTDAPDGDDTGHILLGRRLSSPLAVSQYTAAVSGTLQPFLAQHRVFDIVVVPGTAHFDLAAAAGMDHFGTDRIRLENVVLREALMLDEGERTVQVLVSPTENGADFEIFSRGAGQGQGEWHQHVSGQLAPAHERSAENVDLDRLREGCDEVDVQAFYEKFDAYGAVQYGPAFRSLRRLWRTRGGAVAEVALDSAERGKKGGFIIHPALLDSCLQSMVAALAATEDDLTGDGFMPFSVEKVIFHGRAPETVWCRAVMKEGDSFRQEMFSASFTIFTPEGEPVCEIVNLTMRRTNKETLELLKAGQRQHTDLCYDVVWRQALMPEAGDAAGHWLILAGRDTDFARALARSLEQQGATAMLAACAGTGHPDDMAAVDPGDADAFARLIRDWRQGGTPRGVVFLWGLDCYETDFLGSGGEAPFKNHTAQAFLHLAQALAAQEDVPSVRLAVLTCQAQAARASDQPVPAQSLLWGLEKSVANELGNIAPVIIDMDPVAAPEAQLPTLCGLLTARGYKEDKLALRGGSLLAPRLVRGLPAARQVRNAPLARPETQAYHLDLGGAGIENIRVAPLQRRLPGPGEIEIAAEAYGMNFQNVMVAMGVADKIRTLVLDCAGTVSAVGEGVTRFSPGDRVFTTVYGPFASHVYAREAFAASIPEGMPFTDAAVIPTVFMTAWQALVHAARLQPGERVLLHSATGGVGLAAIQIARARGAVILATAGTERKRALLRSMGIEHVFSSRSTAFESRVLKATGGQGVHVVLNFLTGELADSSMRCLTEGGRFIEIGKTDLRTPAQVAAIRDDIEYHIVDLEKLGKEDEAQMRGIFAAVMEGFAAGHYTPIARRVFTMDAARDAFRYMLEGRHIGKVVVRNDFAPRHEGIRREAAYLVTGGLSDLGLALAAHLAARGAGQVWLLGRRLPEAGSAGAAAVEKIAATGCDVRLLQVDVTDRAALAEAFGTHLLPSPMPLAGVFHLAGLLDDAPLSRLDWARFNTVLSPKVDGSWFLHELTRDLALDHFVVFSSIASVFGTHGQANHVAANTFMDALVAARRADFLPGLSINWGAWGELGTVVRLGILDRIRQQGVEGFDTATGLAVLDRLMASGEGSKVVTRMDWNRMLPILQATAGAAMYEELRHSPAAAAARPAETAGNSRLAAELRALPMSGREERLRAYLKKEIAGFLRLEEDAIPEDVNLTSLGMDSLISLDLFQRISRDLKIRIAPHEVSATPTVQAMAARFARDLGPASGEEETAPAVQSGTPATKEEGAGLSALLVPAPEEAFEPFPLSDMQQAYWIGRDQSGLALGGVSCHFYFEAQAQGLDADRYEEAWNRLILRQPMLRTIILDGERQQVLEKVPHYTIRRHDLRQSSPEEAAAHFERIRMEMSHEVLDVGRWPNFRVEVSLLPDDALRIHLSFDLILSDFHGISQMLAELSLIYNGQEDKLPVLDITFRDYRLAEERYRATGIYARDRDYWLARLDDLPAAPRLPLATSPAAIDRPVFSRRMTTLDKETWQRIKQRGDARGLAPTAVALATFAEVLGCWSEEKRFCINLTLFNRLPLHRQVNALVGEFTSNSLLAVDLTQGGSFETRAGRLWSRLWDDMEHRSFSGIRVLRELGRRRGTAAGIMPVIFTSALSMESSSGTFALGQMG